MRPHTDGARGSRQAVAFVLCLAAAVASAADTLPRLVDAALFRCPRCSGLFHAAAHRARPVLRLRACAHCRLPLDGGDGGGPAHAGGAGTH